jgi:CheY-like chemotaxis protein
VKFNGAGAHEGQVGDVKATRRGRILIIDDEPAVGRTLHRLLGGDHDVTVLCDGQQALELIGQGTHFDVVLCDLTMPDLSGIDVYERCRAGRPDLAQRFVFMTGGTFSNTSREFLDSVGNCFIEKPFDLQTIRLIVKQRVDVLATQEA